MVRLHLIELKLVKNLTNIERKAFKLLINRREPFESSNVMIQGVRTIKKNILLQFTFLVNPTEKIFFSLYI